MQPSITRIRTASTRDLFLASSIKTKQGETIEAKDEGCNSAEESTRHASASTLFVLPSCRRYNQCLEHEMRWDGVGEFSLGSCGCKRGKCINDMANGKAPLPPSHLGRLCELQGWVGTWEGDQVVLQL